MKTEVMKWIEVEREPDWRELMKGDGDPADAWDELESKGGLTEMVPETVLEENISADAVLHIEQAIAEEQFVFEAYMTLDGDNFSDSLGKLFNNPSKCLREMGLNAAKNEVANTMMSVIEAEATRIRKKMIQDSLEEVWEEGLYYIVDEAGPVISRASFKNKEKMKKLIKSLNRTFNELSDSSGISGMQRQLKDLESLVEGSLNDPKVQKNKELKHQLEGLSQHWCSEVSMLLGQFRR